MVGVKGVEPLSKLYQSFILTVELHALMGGPEGLEPSKEHKRLPEESFRWETYHTRSLHRYTYVLTRISELGNLAPTGPARLPIPP